jgi:hypothetical protein
MADDFDSPWKLALEIFLQPLIELCFPQIAAAIDWKRGWTFMDTELQAILRDAATGRQYVDKLIKVYLHDGQEQWILLHIEIQHRRETGFEKRVFRYNHRIEDVYDRPVVTMVILADQDVNWRPTSYETHLLGCRTRFDFPISKLLAFNREELESNGSPAALLVLANLMAQETGSEPTERFGWKVLLTEKLYERGYLEQQLVDLFRLIDWLMALPEPQEQAFRIELQRIQEEKKMPYITSIERLAKKEGLAEGLEQGRAEARHRDIIDVLEVRFGSCPEAVLDHLTAEQDMERLRDLLRRAATCQRPGELLS